MLRVAVCDDEKACLAEIKQMLECWSLESSTPLEIHCFDNGDTLLTKSESVPFDIVFLDIIMPLLSGMDTARELRGRDKAVKLVFLTSSPEFALQSYSVKAADYCIKPITYERLKTIMEDCAATHSTEPESITLKTIGGYQKICLHDIEYIEAQNKKVFFFLNSDTPVEVLQPLYTFETRLSDSKGFFKCHRSYLVYIPNVDYFSNVEIKTKSGTQKSFKRLISALCFVIEKEGLHCRRRFYFLLIMLFYCYSELLFPLLLQAFGSISKTVSPFCLPMR